MSYDLFFRPRAGQPMPSTGELGAWFAQRGHYTVGNVQAIYEHEDTGVYFIFDLPTAAGGDDADDAPSLAFNLNYARPGCFALEAAPELEALLARFAFDVEDPQIDGMDDGPYTREGFLRGWAAGNDVAVQAFLADAHTRSELLTLPAATIQRVWEWNRARKDLQARLGDDVFVPKISYVVHGGAVQTAAVWADGIPLALPPVEQLVLARDRLAPRRFLRRVEDICLCAYADAAPLLQRFAAPSDGAPYLRLAYLEAPAEVMAFFRARAPAPQLAMVGVDRVLEVELIDRLRPSS